MRPITLPRSWRILKLPRKLATRRSGTRNSASATRELAAVPGDAVEEPQPTRRCRAHFLSLRARCFTLPACFLALPGRFSDYRARFSICRGDFLNYRSDFSSYRS
ncbi:MAG: hypothetical protein KDA47_12955, partial [Planctomycetales bacterium]|nr:hypothetical protein [Planctomycetales bacterium]